MTIAFWPKAFANERQLDVTVLGYIIMLADVSTLLARSASGGCGETIRVVAVEVK